MQKKRNATGITTRHARSCPSRAGSACRCSPTYQANVWSAREKSRIFKTFPTFTAAKIWRGDAQSALRRGELKTPTRTTVEAAAQKWLAGVKAGTVWTRSGLPYKPSAIRSYEAALRSRIIPEFGGVRLTDVRRMDVQDFVDRLAGSGLDASTIRNTLVPMRVVYRHALERGEVAVNPTAGVRLPAVSGVRDRIASPSEAAELLAALQDDDRALWATAFYAGLRRGELLALHWDDIDLDGRTIRVERSWDEREGPVAPKSRAGRRTVPIPEILRRHLIELRLRSGRTAGFVFGTEATRPFTASNVWRRARSAWRSAELEPIRLHEARHTYASLSIAAGVNAKALTTYMGHSSISVTFDRYGHLMQGNEAEAAARLDQYLATGTLEAPSADVL
jgi:integrase